MAWAYFCGKFTSDGSGKIPAPIYSWALQVLKYWFLQQKAQLNSGGADPAIIMCLLKDSQQWNTLRIRLKNHLLRSKSLLLDFKSQSILHPDLVDSIDIPKLMAFGGDESFASNIKAIRELSTKIQIIEDECKKGITSLQSDTKEMIQLVSTPFHGRKDTRSLAHTLSSRNSISFPYSKHESLSASREHHSRYPANHSESRISRWRCH